MHITRGTIVAAVASTIIASAAWSPAAGSPASCGEIPEPQRWVEAGQPDTGSTPTVSAHRGASGLAPENTLWAYRHAFAYGAEMVEVDVRTTADGHYVSMHDGTVDRTTNGTGPLSSLTLEQIKELNAADYAPWSGTEYDPARVPTLEEILAVAASAGGGIEFDIKDVADPSDLAKMADQFGILERSAFNSQDPRIQAAYPAARLIYNRDTFEPPGSLYAIGSTYTYFGSRLDEYSPGSIAEIHDACGLVIPHAYDRTKGDEAADLAYGRSIGIDGAQVNSPDVAAAALGEPVPTALLQGPLSEPASLCLVNSNNGFGIPNKPVAIDRGDGQAVEVTTRRSGCAPVPPGLGDNPHARFTGDPATQPSSTDQPSQGPGLELERAHAHNDYEHERPLFDALANGFKSVEADIWLVGDRLLIGHDYPDPTLTLESLYLDPLKSIVETNGGSVYPGDADYLTLLVDVKSEASTTYAELDRHLQPYSNILTRFTQESMQRGPVTIIVSGNRDRAAMQEQQVRLAAYDGRMADLGNGGTASLTPLISDNWTTVFDWDGTGEMPQEERQRLDEIVQTAHANGQRVRFWNTPDGAGAAREAVWEVELEAHVDLFNTDHLADLRAFLLGADLMPNKPYVP